MPSGLKDKVVTAMHQYVQPGREKLMELLRGKFYFPFWMSVLKEIVTELVKRCPVCHTCKTGPARFDECKYFPIPQYPSASLAIDFVSLPEVTESGEVFDQSMVIVDRLTRLCGSSAMSGPWSGCQKGGRFSFAALLAFSGAFLRRS